MGFSWQFCFNLNLGFRRPRLSVFLIGNKLPGKFLKIHCVSLKNHRKAWN